MPSTDHLPPSERILSVCSAQSAQGCTSWTDYLSVYIIQVDNSSLLIISTTVIIIPTIPGRIQSSWIPVTYLKKNQFFVWSAKVQSEFQHSKSSPFNTLMDLSSHLVTIVKTLMHLGHMGETSDKVCTHADMGSKVLKHRLYSSFTLQHLGITQPNQTLRLAKAQLLWLETQNIFKKISVKIGAFVETNTF